jgi:hypothetical protein
LCKAFCRFLFCRYFRAFEPPQNFIGDLNGAKVFSVYRFAEMRVPVGFDAFARFSGGPVAFLVALASDFFAAPPESF